MINAILFGLCMLCGLFALGGMLIMTTYKGEPSNAVALRFAFNFFLCMALAAYLYQGGYS